MKITRVSGYLSPKTFRGSYFLIFASQVDISFLAVLSGVESGGEFGGIVLAGY